MQYFRLLLLGLISLATYAGCVSTPQHTDTGCPGSTLTEARIREIGYAAARSYEPRLPKDPPAEERVVRDGCSYIYTAIFSERTIGSFITVLIDSDGRVLGVAPGL